MRKPDTIERLYLDFDGFFASVMQQCFPGLRGKPVGVIPFETDQPDSTSVIACSKEAKRAGCKNVMGVPEARAICPDLILVPQRPDLYRRAQAALLNEIACEIPIDVVKSIDELTCRLDRESIVGPRDLGERIKARLRNNIGVHITCSIGFAANRMLAKMACARDKPDGLTIWSPFDMPAPVIELPLGKIPGVGSRMEQRLNRASIVSVADLLATQPKQLRKIWGNVNGERMWYALHGYDIQAMPTERGMYGHGRVLPPDLRTFAGARGSTRLLLSKAARRMRRDGYYANRLHLHIDLREGAWSGGRSLSCVNDDQACLSVLMTLWSEAEASISVASRMIRVGVVLMNLTSSNARQLDMFLADDFQRLKWESVTSAMDRLNRKFGRRVVSLGPSAALPGDMSGAKIAFGRIPSAEDFW